MRAKAHQVVLAHVGLVVALRVLQVQLTVLVALLPHDLVHLHSQKLHNPINQ